VGKYILVIGNQEVKKEAGSHGDVKDIIKKL